MKITDTIGAVLRNKAVNRVLSIAPSQSVYEALELMAQNDVGALLVLDDGKLAGIFSERDYARKGVLMGHHSRETQVSEVMTSPVFFVNPENSVDDGLNLMTTRHFRHLPVVLNDEVVGLVSIGDLVKWVISGQAHAIESLQGYISGSYPA
ncbi:MAG: CBS domain-containing protein [Terracidiphilus sp.]